MKYRVSQVSYVIVSILGLSGVALAQAPSASGSVTVGGTANQAQAPAAPPTESWPSQPASPWATGATGAPVEPVAVATQPEPPPPVYPEKLTVAKDGFFQPSALLQFWLVGQSFDRADGDGASTQFQRNTLRLRRAELRVKGEIVPGLVAYNVMIDPARVLETSSTTVVGPNGSVTVQQGANPASILQDFSVTILSEYADVSVGQFKIPVSYEGYYGSSKLLFPERAAAARQFGDRRDVGIKVDKKFKHFYYAATVFNGAGQNRLDNDLSKDAALRLEAYPFEGLTIGAVGYATVGKRDTSTTRDRIEGDLKLDWNNILVQAEYIMGWDAPAGGAAVEAHGTYGAAGYTIAKKVQPVVRIGYVEANKNADTGLFSYELGVNYFLKGHEAKLQLGLGMFDDGKRPNLSANAGGGLLLTRRWEAILAAQASF